MDKTESNIDKCPVMHGSMTKNTTSGTSNKDWWPDQLNLTFFINMIESPILWVKILITNQNLRNLIILL